MKRKVGSAGKLRLSPNEEAYILKEDYERRRKLRLLQVREQERGIALQLREDIKQRRNQQLTRLAEELRTEWEESQTQKIKNLEKLYLASLRTMGEGHQHAKENEPDLNALAQRAAERRRKAEMRHKEALKLQKNKKEELVKQKTWHIAARKEALLVEKERSAKITSLPPPPPALFENIELKRTSDVKTGRSTYHHLCTFVNKERDTKQPDPHLAAEEEAKRLEERQKQAAQERMEQCEKAHVRGFQAMKKIHLAQTQERLMKELKQLQQEDLARRRQTVAQMPPQLVELPYKRSEMREDWQRELEFAFEDMYNADRMKGNLILHLEPEPLPTVTDQIQDEELDLSMEQESGGETENIPVTEAETICSSKADVPLAIKTHQVPSKILFKKLLNKIRSQKSLWTIKSISEDESEVITSLSETDSKAPTVESGATVGEERTSSSGQEQVAESDTLTVDSGPLTSEERPLSLDTDSEKEQEMKEAQPVTAVAQSSVLLHPQEEAARIRMEARQKQIMEIEEQKQKQLELLEQIQQQKLRLESDCFRAQLEEEKRKTTQQTGVGTPPAPCSVISDEDDHRQMIRNYQHQLLQQNRFHRESVETARKRLLEYQTILKEKYSSGLGISLTPGSVIPLPPQNSERPTVTSEHWDQDQRPNLIPNKYPPVPSIQISKSEQDYFQVPRQSLFPQGQVETDRLITLDILAKQSLESQEQPKQFSQSEDRILVHKDSHILSEPLSHDGLLIIQDPKEISRATTSQTLDPQQRFSENKESIPCKLTERPSFQPLAAEHAFSSLPVAIESGNIQESFSATSKSTVSVSHISQMQGKSLPASENITAQLGNLKALQEQLDLQKEVLRSRQEAQERLLLYKQKELEGQTGLSVSLPLGPLDSFATLPSARAESGRIQESFPTRDDTSGRLGVPRLPNRLLRFSQSVLPQQDNFKFLQEQLNIQRDILQARREAQEVSCLLKQSELDRRIWSGQTALSSLPSQVAQHTVTLLPSAGTHSGKIQEQSESAKGLLLSQSENQKSQDGSLNFLQQFLPLHNSLQLLQEQVTTRRDALQARQEARAELLLHRPLGDSKSGQMSSSLPPAPAPCLFASQASAATEPRRIQNFYLSGKESVTPSSHLVIPTFQDEPCSFPQRNLPRQENLTALQELSHTHRVMVGAEQETQEFVHKPHESEKTVSSEQTGTSLSLSQVAESGRFQEFMPTKSDSTVPLSYSKVPRFQERLPGFSQPTLPLQGNLEKHQEWLDTEKVAFHFSQKTQGNVSSEPTDSSFEPQVGQPSCTSLPSAESGTTQEPPSTESDSKSLSVHLQIPQLQDRLLRISQLIRPQQDNLKALGERLATQREAIVQSRQEAQAGLLLHEQSEWKQGVSPEQVGSPFLAPVVQPSFASLPLSEPGRIQEPCSTKSDNTASSRHSEIPGLPDSLFSLSQPVSPQQGHLHAERNSLPRGKKTQKDLVLPRQYTFEEKLPSEHFVQLPHGDFKVLQEQLEIQKKAIRSRQEVQEELLLQKLSKLEKRVSSEQIGSSLLPQVAPPVDSEGLPKPLASRSNHTLASGHLGIPTSQDRHSHSSPPGLPLSDTLTARLDLEREVAHSNEEGQEEPLLNTQTKSTESESSEHVIPSLFLPTQREHSFIPLPFAEVKSKNHGELYSSKNQQAAPTSNSMISRLQDRLVCFSKPVLTQQDNLGLQKQLDLQKKVLHCSQKAQEELLVQRQTTLQQQVQKHQETLRDFLKYSQISKPTAEGDTETQKLREWLPLLQDLAGGGEGISPASRSNPGDNQLLSEETGAQQSGEHLDKELGGRSSKPPVAKVKCGLDLNQHELSAIPEVESPASGRTSILGKPDFYQDRDPLRVSVSREQSFLGSPLNCDAFGCVYPLAQENVCGDDSKDAVRVNEAMAENHAVLSYSVDEEHTYLSAAVKTENAETEEIYHEPLSSVTVSTGSFLSYENTDLSLTDPGSFSELDPREQESTTGKEEERDILSPVLPSSQVLYQRQDPRDIHQSLLPALEKFTPVDLDFPELEHAFPNLHRQLFKPLEPYPDFDISSSYSGISQDSRDLYQNLDSSCEGHHAVAASRSPASPTAPRTRLSSSNTSPSQQPDPLLAPAAAQISATGNTEGSEQSFQQLLPEFTLQDGSQHVDLPSIFSIEARDFSQGTENQNYSEQTEIQNKKKSVHFDPCVGNLQSSVFSSSDEASVFHPLSLQYSTPCGSTSSERSVKAQAEGRKERLEFEELSERGLSRDENETRGVLNINSPVQEIDFQSCVRTVEMGNSVQAPYSVQNEKVETPEILRNLSQLAQSELFLSSGSLQSSIPVWETESGHGIMEEPELTLVSTSDISIAEMDFANLTLEEKKGNEAKSSSQVSEFLPLVSERETLDCPDVSEHCTEEGVVVSAETPPKMIALPESLQEAFVKRKKSFIERSSQRQKEIKNKIRIPQNSKTKIAKEKSTGSSVSHLKGVKKVTVRVSLPEDRKTAQALMHERALRSYNQLAEVKQQREDKAKQDAYAQNRARAKEFHKQTLEKLRAKNTR